MKLPFLNLKKNLKEKIYLGLFLKENQAVAFVIKDEGKAFKLVDKEKFTYSNGWENLTQDFDKVIFQLEEKLNINFQEIILFVYSHIVDLKNKEIKKEYLLKIKKLIKDLELKPLGYIECCEAVVSYFEKKEELPLTALVVELDETKMSLFVYKGGTVTFSKTIDRSDNIIKDFTNAIEEVRGKMLLPSKIILYDSKDLDKEISKILTHQWSEDFFIQLPRVHVVKENEITDGLIKIFQNQISSGTKEVIISANIDSDNEQKKEDEIFGFKIGADISDVKQNLVQETKQEDDKQEIIQKARLIELSKLLHKIKNIIKKIHFKPKFKIGTNNKNQGVKFIIIGVILIISGLFLNEYFFHKASLTLYLPSQKIIEEITISEDEIPIETSTISAVLTESKVATGKKEIGEKAKGAVTIHNFSSASKTFNSGTVVSTNGINFSLDQDVNVASASNVMVGSSLVKQPGRVKVGVVAVEIGPQGNIQKNQEFSIENNPSDTFLALNEEAMSGGTKKEITTVSKKDIDDLKSLVLEKGERKNKSQVKSENKVTMLEDMTESNFSKQNFSKEIGEEAENVSLEAKVESSFYFINNNSLLSFLSKKLEKKLLSGFILDKTRINFTIINVSKNTKNTEIDLKVNAYATKDISHDKIIELVKAKKQSHLDKILKENYEIKGFKIRIYEPLPLINQWTPFFKKNIDLKISIL